MAYLTGPPPVDDSWLIPRNDYKQAACLASRSFGYEGEASCDLRRGHPGKWHYCAGEDWLPEDGGTWFWDRA